MGDDCIKMADILPLKSVEIDRLVTNYVRAHPTGILTDVRDCQSLADVQRWMTTHPNHPLSLPFQQMFEDNDLAGGECYTLEDFLLEADMQQIEHGCGYG
jgi:hypothetical protein